MTLRPHALLATALFVAFGSGCLLGPNYAKEGDGDPTSSTKKKKKTTKADSGAAIDDEGEDEEDENAGTSPASTAVDSGVANPTTPASTTPDAGAAANTTDVFATGPAYASSPPARQAHQNSGIAIQATTNCMQCHGTGGNGPPFVIGGAVVRGATPVADAEVRVVTTAGTITKTNSDTRGFFWIAGATPLAASSRVGARTTAQKVSMKAAAGNGGCNGTGSCHGGSQGLVDLAAL